VIGAVCAAAAAVMRVIAALAHFVQRLLIRSASVDALENCHQSIFLRRVFVVLIWTDWRRFWRGE
jgi:uncharacterized membrane protein